MTFHILQNSTTADATDENDNFYRIGQGSRLPMGGASLTATDSVYDLGASGTAWDNLYANNVYADNVISSDSGLWTKIYDQVLASTSSRWEISSLNGDDDEIYQIIAFFLEDSTTSIRALSINGDSANSYGLQYIYGVAAAPAAARLSSINSYRIESGASPTNASVSFSKSMLYAKTGNERLLLNESMHGAYSTHVNECTTWGQIWNDTTNTITSLVFWDINGHNIPAGSHIIIFKKG